MTDASCPRCGAPAAGKFCSSCGASLEAAVCSGCGHSAAPGARFCNRCGAPIAAASPGPGTTAGPAPSSPPAGSDNTVAWWIAGATLVALILFVAWPVIHPDEGEPTAPVAGPSTAGSPPDLSSMTPREAADRLFNRVMGAVEMGDEATVQGFLPMAIAAYERARPLDPHGLFDLSMLHRAGGDFASALAAAEEGLEADPDHLLLIATAAEADEGLGNEDAARAQWQRFLDLYDEQLARGLEEYTGHANILERSREHALGYLGG